MLRARRLLVSLVFITGFAQSVRLSHIFCRSLRMQSAGLAAHSSTIHRVYFQAWILLEMPGFDANLEHSIFSGDRCVVHPHTLERHHLTAALAVYKWVLGDTDADDIEKADIGELESIAIPHVLSG